MERKTTCDKCICGYREKNGRWWCEEDDESYEYPIECDRHYPTNLPHTNPIETVKECKASYGAIPDHEHTCGECYRFSRHINGACSGMYSPKVTADRKACKYYWDREQKLSDDQKEAARKEEERQKRWKETQDNPPRPAIFKRDFNYQTGGLTGEMPYCPNCDELLYDLDRCYFCGQQILRDEHLEEWAKPPEEHRMDCMTCGGKGTMVYTISDYNGHKRGICHQCGASFIE